MDDTTLDLNDVIKTIKKRARTIIKIFFAFVVLSLMVNFLLSPTYEAETTLRIQQSKGLATSLLSDLPVWPQETKQQMSTYAEILKSRTVIQEVIAKTQGEKENVPTYEEMASLISTQPVKDTEILKINVRANTPEEAQLIANTVVETFLGRLTALVRVEQAIVREFIGQRLQESKIELDRAETALEQYKRTARILAPDLQTQNAVSRFSDLMKLQGENAVAQVSAQARLASISQQMGDEKPGFIADSPLIQQYKSKLATLEVDLATLLQKYTEKHPQVIATRTAITETRDKLDVEIARVVNAEAPSMNPIHQNLLQSKLQSEAELAAAYAQKQAIDRILTEGEQQLTTLPAKEQGLAKLMRDASVAQEIYIMLAKRHEEARISEVMQPTDVQVIDVAVLPERPVAPRKGHNVVLAGLLGIFAGLAWAFFREFMDKSIRTPEDVKQYLDLPILGSIPEMAGDVERPKHSGLWSRIKQLLFKKKNLPGSM